MKKLLVALTLGLFVTSLQAQELPLYPKVKLKTNRGTIVLELDTARAHHRLQLPQVREQRSL